MSESEGETDDDAPSLKKINERIDKETTTEPISTSPGESVFEPLSTIEQRRRNECQN